jgi:autotransporter-associated beta strand protein
VNTFDGDLTISGGTVTLGGSGSLGAGTYAGAITLASGATLLDSSSANQVLSGVISGAGGVTKDTSASTLVLSGNNTFSGGTNVNVGTLQLGSATALGVSASSVTIASGAVLDLNGQSVTNTNKLTINGTGIDNAGALMNSSNADASYAGLVTLGSASSIVGGSGSVALSHTGTMTGTYDLTLGGAVGGSIASIIGTGSGTVTKTDAGTWTLAGANTYTGDTTITGGSIVLGGSGSLYGGSYGGNVSIASGASFKDSSSTDQVLSGVISGAGSLVKDTATSTLTLSGANTYSGGTTISAGTLQLGTSAVGVISGPVGTGSVVLSGTGSLDLAGQSLSNTITLDSATSTGALTNSDAFVASVVTGAVQLSQSATIGGMGELSITGQVTSNGYGLALLGAGAKTLSNTGNLISAVATASAGVGAITLINDSALTLGAVTVGGTTFAGMTTGGSLAITNSGGISSAAAVSANAGLEIYATGTASDVTLSAPVRNTGGSNTGIIISTTGNLNLGAISNSGSNGIQLVAGLDIAAGVTTGGTIMSLGTVTNNGGVVALSMASPNDAVTSAIGITSANTSALNTTYLQKGGVFVNPSSYAGGNYVVYRRDPYVYVAVASGDDTSIATATDAVERSKGSGSVETSAVNAMFDNAWNSPFDGGAELYLASDVLPVLNAVIQLKSLADVQTQIFCFAVEQKNDGCNRTTLTTDVSRKPRQALQQPNLSLLTTVEPLTSIAASLSGVPSVLK